MGREGKEANSKRNKSINTISIPSLILLWVEYQHILLAFIVVKATWPAVSRWSKGWDYLPPRLRCHIARGPVAQSSWRSAAGDTKAERKRREERRKQQVAALAVFQRSVWLGPGMEPRPMLLFLRLLLLLLSHHYPDAIVSARGTHH